MEEKQPICSNCENFINEVINHDVWTESVFKCKKCIIHIDTITGDVVYGSCSSKNFRGDCEDFKYAESNFTKFVNKLKNIFDIKKKD